MQQGYVYFVMKEVFISFCKTIRIFAYSSTKQKVNFLDRYQNTFCVNSLCDATGICLFCYERGIHLFLQNNSYFCVFKYETKGQTKGLERGWKQRGRLGRDATTGRQYYFSCLTRPTTLTPRFTDFFTDFEKKNPTMLQSILLLFRLRTQL